MRFQAVFCAVRAERSKPRALVKRMSHSSHNGAVTPTGDDPAARPNTRRRMTPLLHLPTWSRLVIATKQRVPTGRGGDFFEVVQHRDGRVTTFMADVCGNGPK